MSKSKSNVRFIYGVLTLMLLVGLVLPAGVAAAPRAGDVSVAAPQGRGTSANFYKIEVTADGLYRLTYAALQAAGLPVATLNPRTLQLYNSDGAEVAIYVSGESDARFDPGDFILFYGLTVNTQYAGVNVYWLTYGVQSGLRMSTRSVAPGAAPSLARFPTTLHLEQNVIYKGDVPKTGLADRWYWESYSSSCNWVLDPVTGTYTCIKVIPTLNYNVTLPAPAPGPGWATLRADLRGSSSNLFIAPDHHVVFFVNGFPVGENVWDGLATLGTDNDVPVAGAGPYDWEGNASASGNCVRTTAGGNYFFDGLAAGNYVVDIALVNFYGSGVLKDWKPSPQNVGQSTPPSQSNDLTGDSDGSPVTKDAGVSLNNGQAFMHLDFGFVAPTPGATPGSATTTSYTPNGTAAVGDRVWYDADNNGVQDAGELGIENVLVCLYQDNGNGYYNGPSVFSQSRLVAGANQISFTAPQDTGIDADSGLVNWLELDYDAQFVAVNDELPFSVSQSGAWNATMTGFASSAIWLMDVTAAATPVLLTGASVAPSGGSYALSMQDTTAAPRRYVAVGDGALRAPVSIQADTPSNLRNPLNQADWVIVSHPAFLARPATATVGPPTFAVPTVVSCPPYPQQQATTYVECLSPPEQLARHRQTYSGLKVLVVDVQDVYDEFNGGVIHPEALHQFALTMKNTWAKPAPRYLALVGDGHYDPRNYLGNSEPVYIPPYLAPIDQIIGEVAAPNRIVSEWPTLDSASAVPFMGLGVLPVNSLAQAQTMVDKIISYETTPITDGWNMRMTWVADDADVAGNFPAHMDEIADDATLIPPSYTDQKIYLKSQAYPTVDGTTDAIINAINAGTLFVSYDGHGSRNAWAGERILELPDIPRMTNSDRLPIFLPMTCLEGNYIVPNFPSFAESAVRQAGGGPVASWSGTGRGVSTGHQVMLKGFYEAIFGQNMIRLGDITTYAKQALKNSNSTFTDLIDAYVILGDPATAVQVPQADLAVSLTANDPSPAPGETFVLTISYVNNGSTTAEGLTLDALLPPELINWSWAGTPGATQTGAAQWQLPNLASGASGTIVITGVINPNSTVSVHFFQADVATTTHEGHLADNSAVLEVVSDSATYGRVAGHAWIDTDLDEQLDVDEVRADGAVVALLDGAGNELRATVADAQGAYSFEGVAPATYTVRIKDYGSLQPVSPTSVPAVVTANQTTTVNFTFAATTAVSVTSLRAYRSRGSVVVSWTTASEQDVQGYNVYRGVNSTVLGQRANPTLLAAHGDGAYSFTDVKPGNAQFYWIEVVAADGNQVVGPVLVDSARFQMFLPVLQRQR